MDSAFQAYNKIIVAEQKLGDYRPSQDKQDTEIDAKDDDDELAPQERADKEAADFEKKMAISE